MKSFMYALVFGALLLLTVSRHGRHNRNHPHEHRTCFPHRAFSVYVRRKIKENTTPITRPMTTSRFPGRSNQQVAAENRTGESACSRRIFVAN